MMVVTPALAAIGIDVNKLIFSRSTLMEARTTEEMLKKGPFLSTYNSFLYLYPLPLAPSYPHYIHSYTCRHPKSKTGACNTGNSLF